MQPSEIDTYQPYLPHCPVPLLVWIPDHELGSETLRGFLNDEVECAVPLDPRRTAEGPGVCLTLPVKLVGAHQAENPALKTRQRSHD